MAVAAIPIERAMTLASFIGANLARPFIWGEWDCVTLASEWVKIKTGGDPLAGLPEWHNAREALRVIKSVGGLAAALDARFNRVHPNKAKDGDIALYKNCLCLFSGVHIVGPNVDGLTFVSRLDATIAWSVA